MQVDPTPSIGGVRQTAAATPGPGDTQGWKSEGERVEAVLDAERQARYNNQAALAVARSGGPKALAMALQLKGRKYYHGKYDPEMFSAFRELPQAPYNGLFFYSTDKQNPNKKIVEGNKKQRTRKAYLMYDKPLKRWMEVNRKDIPSKKAALDQSRLTQKMAMYMDKRKEAVIANLNKKSERRHALGLAAAQKQADQPTRS